MLSDRLIELIEAHADALTRSTLNALRESPRTPSYRPLPDEAMRDRIDAVYHELGNWLAEKTRVIQTRSCPPGEGFVKERPLRGEERRR